MATLLLATAPDNASAANYTARFNRAITLGPQSKVYVKSASMTLGQSYAIQTGSNDTIQFATGPTNDLVTATVASGEYTGRDALAAAVTTAMNNAARIEPIQDTATAGNPYVETCSSCSVTTNDTNFVVSILGPQIPTGFPVADTTARGGAALGATGVTITRAGGGDGWRAYCYINKPQSRGSSIFQFSMNTGGPKDADALGGLAATRRIVMDPSQAVYGIRAPVGGRPEIYIDGVFTPMNGMATGLVGQGDYFRIVRDAGKVYFLRSKGQPAVVGPGQPSQWGVMHDVDDRSMVNLHGFVSLYTTKTVVRNLLYTPDITAPFDGDNGAEATDEEADENAILGAIDPTMLKRIICGSIGLLLGFKVSQQYNSAATAIGTISSDQVQATTGVFPSVQIRCPSLPVETWDSASGQVQNIIANIDKQSLLQDPTGLQQLYVEYSPTPLKCYFRQPTAISSVQIVITDNDGNIVTGLTGRTTVMLAFVE